MSDVLDLTAAHLLDLRPVRFRDTAPLTPVPDTVTPILHRFSPTGWRVDFARLPSDGVLTVLTNPHGDHVVLAVEADWIERDDQLAEPHALHMLVRDYRPDAFGDREPLTEEKWQQMIERTWARVERMHQIARSLPRLDALTVSLVGTDKMRERRQSRHTGRVDYVRAALSWASFSEENAVRWQAVGFDEAREARRYAQRDLDPESSWAWFLIGVPPEVVIEAEAAGWTAVDVQALERVFGEGDYEDRFFPDHRKAWIRSGLSPRLATLACAAGLSAEEAPGMDLEEAGLRTLAALRGQALNNLPTTLDTTSAMT